MRPPKSAMYRMPWSLNDNPIGWLEITDKCNIYCRGCYRRNITGHKPLEQIKEEIRFFKEWRNCDNISIAGGEPLIHPEIMEIVAFTRELKMKPLILTNGVRLTDNKPLLRELKQAGVFGFTFHIDSEQQRPNWKGKTEEDLLALRLAYARMVKEVGGLYCSVGATIYPTNIDDVPRIVRWANNHTDLIQGVIFIAFRAAPQDGKFTYYANGGPIEEVEVSYTAEDDSEISISSADIYEKIKSANQNYEPSAYLGGSQRHDAVKWMLNAQVGGKNEIYGSLGAKAMEIVQAGHHFTLGTYMGYTSLQKFPKIAFLALGAFDKGVREAHRNYWKAILKNPLKALQPVYTQSIAVIQAPDILDDGRQDMCDSCPDMTVWDGGLVHSCRMDEWRLYGTYMVAQPNTADKDDVPVMPSEETVAANK
ncbi:MAG: radical SAM protein [Anaerolineae bacterium]|nr:radical SAM protein [Anaerolineae bacterium]